MSVASRRVLLCYTDHDDTPASSHMYVLYVCGEITTHLQRACAYRTASELGDVDDEHELLYRRAQEAP